ncbi:MAG: hypothetical protein KME04_07980 [Pleurocapsa minor GSE-CHR-MK-17-07R]|jgi:hypothetical protein|nr:hypothetical protein [Pleurocapsa minor GSE-CHR-MK 17-07R]
MARFSDKQFIYEINTWVWLTELSAHYKQTITLENVPEDALNALIKPGLDYIWLMGVWQRSEYGRQIGLKWKHEYTSALPDLTDDDVIGSAYAIADYRVDDRIGGRHGLAVLRERLRQRGVRLILDFVPNHVAFDHPWVTQHPEFIVQGTQHDLERAPTDWFTSTDVGGTTRVLAHGRDPYFPGWSDTAQLNIFHPAAREACIYTVLDIAAQCDGVRCDMAMLLMNNIFASTWRGKVSHPLQKDYWIEMIGAVRHQHPDFLFMAEVYWEKEYDLLLQGFDFCYDKVFYDRIINLDVTQLRQHLVAELAYQQRLVRFLENHDEPRAYDRLGTLRSMPAATLLCTLPGATLLHQGQFEGRRAKLPVQIKRSPSERRHHKLVEHYDLLLKETTHPVYQQGDFFLFHVNPAAQGSTSHNNLLAYGWWNENTKDYRLIVINLTEQRSRGRIDLSPWIWLRGRRWALINRLDGMEFARQGGAANKDGLFVDLDPYESFVFEFRLEDAPAVSPTRSTGTYSEVF